MIINKHHVLVELQRHIGRGQGVTADALAAALHIPARQVRTLITELRLDAHAICGHPRAGYFIAATDQEIEETCQFLRSRALHSLTLESRLRKATLPDLLGQMKLPT